MTALFPPLAADDVPETRIAGKHHTGCIVSQGRAITVARALFPDEIADGADCGYFAPAPCRHCADRNAAWTRRVREVRAAMLEAFK